MHILILTTATKPEPFVCGASANSNAEEREAAFQESKAEMEEAMGEITSHSFARMDAHVLFTLSLINALEP